MQSMFAQQAMDPAARPRWGGIHAVRQKKQKSAYYEGSSIVPTKET